MKYSIFIVLFILTISSNTFSQKPSCNSLTNFIEKEGSKDFFNSHSFLSCSAFLNSVEFYKWTDPETFQTNYYAICKLNFKKYIYASSKELMEEWNKYANTDQCGEAFHEYIKPYKLDCN